MRQFLLSFILLGLHHVACQTIVESQEEQSIYNIGNNAPPTDIFLGAHNKGVAAALNDANIMWNAVKEYPKKLEDPDVVKNYKHNTPSYAMETFDIPGTADMKKVSESSAPYSSSIVTKMEAIQEENEVKEEVISTELSDLNQLDEKTAGQMALIDKALLYLRPKASRIWVLKEEG